MKPTGMYAVAGVLLALCVAAQGADIKFVTEYRYPTSSQVVPITQVGVNGLTTFSGGIVVPENFETREVGVAMSVDATGGSLAYSSDTFLLNRGLTPLIAAAARGDATETFRLLQKGANVNSRDANGATALMAASAVGSAEIVQMLLRKKALVNIETKNGATALSYARQYGNDDVARLLLANGARSPSSLSSGMSAAMVAEARKRAELSAALAGSGVYGSSSARAGAAAGYASPVAATRR
jgi:hypothetical protein